MRVRRLELQGFKSFKDKTIINFDDGITGIVGPNGCGKSNVVDAFFWVMGEQNPRLLRGLAMDDLIFSGSDKSPPSSSAEVTLVLEMAAIVSGPTAPAGASVTDVLADGKSATREVAITRKLYRTGESDYFLNKQPCRLRDIQELFMDTGVGSRGYSIIQQGQIQKIVQAKPEERRTMIEEVAGIVKYKARRKESLRKLESTQQNLLRVTDIVTEIEAQKRQMERQAEKARKYREWKDRLQSIELSFNALKWDDFSEKITALLRDIDELNQIDTALTTAREAEEVQISNKRLESTQAAKVAEEYQEKWMRGGQELSEAENAQKYSQKNLEDLRALGEQLARDAEEERRLVEVVREEHEKLEAQRSSILDDFQAAEASRMAAERASLEHKQSLDSQERTLENQKNDLLRTSGELGEARNQAAYAQTRLEEIQANMARLDEQRTDREGFLGETRRSQDQAQSHADRLRAALEETRNSIQSVSQETSDVQRRLEEQRRQIAALASEQARDKATLSSLEEQKRRHEDSSKGVKTVFQKILPQNEEWKRSVNGTLADVLRVEQGFETAAETALGRSLDLILTNSADVHMHLSSALKSETSGRAAFADVSRAQTSAAAGLAPALENDDIVGPLVRFVNVNEQVAAPGTAELLTQLLSRVYVAINADAATRLAPMHPDCTFVTREGELLRGGWFLEGGDLSQVSGAYVGRNREISDLLDKLGSLSSELDAAALQLQNLEQRLQELHGRRRALEEDFREKQDQVSAAASDAAAVSARAQEAERSLRLLQEEIVRQTSERERLEAARAAAVERTVALEAGKAVLEQSIASGAETLSLARAQAETLQHSLVEARIREAGLLEQKNTIQARYQASVDVLRQRGARIDGLLEQAQKRALEAEQTETSLAELAERIQRLRTEMLQNEQDFRSARERLDILNNEIEELRTSAQENSKKERETKDTLTGKRIDCERLTSERDHLGQNTFERYGIQLAEYSVQPETQEQVQLLRAAGEEKLAETSNEVMLLKEKIRKLGEVNTGAIEEYDALVERYNFLTTQKADLEKSIADLQSTIDKINRVSVERFKRAFDEVNTHFIRVFPVIFGGGHAQLTLTNPEDILETGVDIMAQPPGKKPQNINLLSGGEKTLTAISLLFAIFLVKPSPFCLLDEVDAPLDDANIGRFNALLKEMALRSQFIIITHNKRTMELNDKLYGVTMEDAGISKMISIQVGA